MTINVMIDLETMSTESNAAICSIGAVKFTLEEGIVDTFYCTVDAADCKAHGLVISADTIRWWSTQPKEVLESLRKNNLSLINMLTFVNETTNFIKTVVFEKTIVFEK